MPSSHSPDTLTVVFDDTRAVANAGLALTATLAERLGIERVVDDLVDLGDRPRRSPPRPQAAHLDPGDDRRRRLHRRH
jgi:hypothetical protein